MTGAGLTAGAAARRLGVAVTTLRTWHRRYGLGPSVHEPGQHRRYTPEDVARLDLMLRLVNGGVPPGEAARWAMGGHGNATRAGAGQAATAEPAAEQVGPTAGTAAEPTAGAAAGPGGEVGRRDGGGLAGGGADPAARGLARAALRLDSGAVRALLAAETARLGVIGVWDTVIRPVLAAVGRRHAATGAMIEVEHLLSSCVAGGFATVPRPSRVAPAGVLLACTGEELHTLPLEALDAALAERGVTSRMLGARVPTAALLAAIRRTGPSAVVLWSQHRSTADPGQLAGVLRSRPRPVIVAAAGPGWEPTTLPGGVAHPGSLQDSVDLLRPTFA
jgi:hypothetical protein